MTSKALKTLLVLFCTLFSIVTNAQQKIFELPVGWSGGATVVNSFVASTADQFVLALSKRDSVKVFLVNSAYKIVSQFSATKSSGEKFSGGFTGTDFIALYYQGNNTIRSWVHQVSTGKTQEFSIPFDPKKEKHLVKVSTGNRYLHVATRKKSPVIITYDFDTKGSFKRFEYNLRDNSGNAKLDDDGLWNELSRSIALTREPDVSVINPFELTQPDAVANPSKVYYRDDSLFLVTNKNKEEIKIFSFDLNKNKHDYRIINIKAPMEKGNASYNRSVYNSYVHRDRLYYVSGSDDALMLSINDFYTGEEIIRYEVEKKDTIWFKNTPIIQDGAGNMYGIGAHRELDRTRQFLRKMNAGRAIVSVSTNNRKKNEIIIGGVKEFQGGGGGFNSMGPGMAPVYTGGGLGSSWKRVIRFTLITDPSTDKYIAGDRIADVIEKVEDFKKGIKSDNDSEVVININNTPNFVYYEKDTRKLCAVSIKTN